MTENETMTTTTEATWLDEMQAMPLARGVCVAHPANGRRGIVAMVLRGPLEPGGEGCSVLWDDAGDQPDLHTLYDSVGLVVDLSTANGFGYALRWALARVGPSWSGARGMWSSGLISRHLEGQTTDADRLALAKAYRGHA